MYDYYDDHGFLVQKYGPHTFHTKEKALFDYMCQFEEWQEYKLTCGAVWDGKYTPTPFNFTTIDTFYPNEKAAELKLHLQQAFPGRETATVVEVLGNEDPLVREYAEFLFRNDYAPYTAKQWGISPRDIDPSVLKGYLCVFLMPKDTLTIPTKLCQYILLHISLKICFSIRT